jgi:hypothetical protein
MQVRDPYIVSTEQLLVHRYGIPYLYILRTHRYGIPYLYILLRVSSYYYTCVLITRYGIRIYSAATSSSSATSLHTTAFLPATRSRGAGGERR